MLFRVLLVLVISLSVLYGSSYFIRKFYKVEKQAIWRADYVNDNHERADKIARTIGIMLIVISFLLTLFRIPIAEFWYFKPWAILLILAIVEHAITAFIEKRYKENENYFKATVAEMIIFLLILFVIYQTNWFGFLYNS